MLVLNESNNPSIKTREKDEILRVTLRKDRPGQRQSPFHPYRDQPQRLRDRGSQGAKSLEKMLEVLKEEG